MLFRLQNSFMLIAPSRLSVAVMFLMPFIILSAVRGLSRTTAADYSCILQKQILLRLIGAPISVLISALIEQGGPFDYLDFTRSARGAGRGPNNQSGPSAEQHPPTLDRTHSAPL